MSEVDGGELAVSVGFVIVDPPGGIDTAGIGSHVAFFLPGQDAAFNDGYGIQKMKEL